MDLAHPDAASVRNKWLLVLRPDQRVYLADLRDDVVRLLRETKATAARGRLKVAGLAVG